MKIIEAYHCDYCKKYSKSKGVITRHEKECYHNPVTKACATCKHLRQEDYKHPYWSGAQGVEMESTWARPMCAEGVEISFRNKPEDAIGHRIDLKNNCPLWEQREETEEEEG